MQRDGTEVKPAPVFTLPVATNPPAPGSMVTRDWNDHSSAMTPVDSRVSYDEPAPQLTWEQMNAEYVHELRWWTLDQIAASDAVFVPTGLHALLTTLLRDGPPTDPIDVSG